MVRLLGGVVRDQDARSGFGFVLQALDDHAIVQGAKFHCISLWMKRGDIKKRQPSEES
jgi:hypothetical protein